MCIASDRGGEGRFVKEQKAQKAQKGHATDMTLAVRSRAPPLRGLAGRCRQFSSFAIAGCRNAMCPAVERREMLSHRCSHRFRSLDHVCQCYSFAGARPFPSRPCPGALTRPRAHRNVYGRSHSSATEDAHPSVPPMPNWKMTPTWLRVHPYNTVRGPQRSQ